MISFYQKTIKSSLYLLILLIPLWFLPFGFEKLELNKQYLLFGLSIIAFLSWLFQQILVDKKIVFKKTRLNLLVLVFLGIAILSALFSVDKYSSIFGFYGRFSDGLMSLLSCIFVYFVIVHNTGKDKLLNGRNLVGLLLCSSFFVVTITYLSYFGMWSKTNDFLIGVSDNLRLPEIMLTKGFNTVSGKHFEGLAVFLSVILSILCVLITNPQEEKLKEKKKGDGSLERFFYKLLLFGILGILIILDCLIAWFVLFLSMTAFFVISLTRRMFKDNPSGILLPTFLIGLAVILVMFNPFNFGLPKEEILGQVYSLKIGISSLTNGIKDFFFGSGIGTFYHSFVKNKPASFNQDVLWQARYDRGGNHFFEVMATMGSLGFISYILILITNFKNFVSKQDQSKSILFFLPLLSLIFAQFIFYQNTTLIFLFWFILAISENSFESNQTEQFFFNFKNIPEIIVIFKMILVILILIILGTFYFLGKAYYADIFYDKADNMSEGQDKINALEQSIKWNPRLVDYMISSSRVNFSQSWTESNQVVSEEEASNIFQQRIARSIDMAKQATETSPNHVVAWETLGMIYRDIQSIAEGEALDWGLNSFKTALELDPNNPILHTELGKLYSLSESLELAEKEFNLSLELKPDYSLAIIEKSQLLEKRKDADGAILLLEEFLREYPFDVDAVFQLGRLYYNNDLIDKAIHNLEKAVRLFPDHSNALYTLGIAYNVNGEKEKALSALNRVLELNPNNEELKNQISKISK